MAASLLFIATSLGFAACGPRFTNDNLRVVDEQRLKLEKAGKGLSPKEVESILGQPTRTETTRLPLETQKKEVDVVRYIYKQDGETVELHFIDNKLINAAPRLREAIPAQAAK